MKSKHMLIMLACCLIPLAGFAAISIFKIPANNVLTFGLVLLCPLGHLLMMKYMMPGHQHGDEHAEHVHEHISETKPKRQYE